MGHLYDITRELAFDLVFWLPTKIVNHYFQPLIAMWDDLAENTDQYIKECQEEQGLV